MTSNHYYPQEHKHPRNPEKSEPFKGDPLIRTFPCDWGPPLKGSPRTRVNQSTTIHFLFFAVGRRIEPSMQGRRRSACAHISASQRETQAREVRGQATARIHPKETQAREARGQATARIPRAINRPRGGSHTGPPSWLSSGPRPAEPVHRPLRRFTADAVARQSYQALPLKMSPCPSMHPPGPNGTRRRRRIISSTSGPLDPPSPEDTPAPGGRPPEEPTSPSP